MSRLPPSCAVIALLLVGCARPAEPAQVPALAVTLPDPPPPPEHGLPVPPLDEDWSPPRTVAGDLDGLAAALAGSNAIKAVLAPRLRSSGPDASVRGAVEQLAPSATWSLETKDWAETVAGTLPLDRVEAGTPRYSSAGVTPANPVDATTLVIADAPLDLQRWRAMPAAYAGSCQPIYEGLALAQEQSLAYAEPFLDHADTVLRLQFRAGLAQVLPELEADVEPYASPEPPVGATPAEAQAHVCGHVLHQRVAEASTCLQSDACSLAPRLVLRGGAAVAMPAAPWQPDDCEQTAATVESTLQRVATEATVATVSQLEPRWVTLADRIGAMGAVYEALEDLCSPRRRRFAAEDLVDARARLKKVERALASTTLDESGRWDVQLGSLFVPGAGPMVTLATFAHAEAGAAQTAIVEAKGVRRFLLSRSLCRSGYGELPLSVAVFEPGRPEATFFGYLYEEALLCADLPLPLSEPPPVPVSDLAPR